MAEYDPIIHGKDISRVEFSSMSYLENWLENKDFSFFQICERNISRGYKIIVYYTIYHKKLTKTKLIF